MRKIDIAILIALSASLLAAQQPSIDQLLARLKSPDMDTREIAFMALSKMPDALQQQNVEEAIANLLVLEDQILDQVIALPPGSKVDPFYEDEGFEGYEDAMQGVLQHYATTNRDPVVLRALLQTNYVPSGTLAAWLAHQSDILLPDIVAMSHSNRDDERNEAIGVLADVLVLDKRKAAPMAPEARMQIKEIIEQAAHDTDDANLMSHVAAINALGTIADPEDDAVLAALASSPTEKDMSRRTATSALKRLRAARH